VLDERRAGREEGADSDFGEHFMDRVVEEVSSLFFEQLPRRGVFRALGRLGTVDQGSRRSMSNRQHSRKLSVSRSRRNLKGRGPGSGETVRPFAAQSPSISPGPGAEQRPRQKKMLK